MAAAVPVVAPAHANGENTTLAALRLVLREEESHAMTMLRQDLLQTRVVLDHLREDVVCVVREILLPQVRARPVGDLQHAVNRAMTNGAVTELLQAVERR